MQKILRVGAYARVSTEEQKKFGFSIAAQTDKLKLWVEQNNYQLVDMFVDEGFSASSMKRPALQEMLSRLDEIDVIVFTRLDRFSRNVLDANKTLEQLRKHNVAMISIEEDDIDTTTADGMFMFNLKVNLAERELRKTSERIKSVFEYKVKDGQVITGLQPFGYKIGIVDGKKRVIKDPDTEHIVEAIFSHYLTHHSIRGTMLYINDEYNLSMKYNTYARMLKKEVYMGAYRGNKGYCPAYITEEQFNRIQTLRTKNIRHMKNSHVYLFSGLIMCPVCNRPMAGHQDHRRYTYYTYRCNHHYLHKTCSNGRTYNESRLIEPYLLNNIDRIAEEYILSLKNAKPLKRDNMKVKRDSLKREMDNLNYLFLKGRMNPLEYDKLYDELEKKLKALDNTPSPEADIRNLKAFLDSDWRNIYSQLSDENKQSLWQNIIKEIHIDSDLNISVTFL